MSILNVYIDDETAARLRKISEEVGRSVADLAEASVAEAALDFFRGRPDDPARKPAPRAGT